MFQRLASCTIGTLIGVAALALVPSVHAATGDCSQPVTNDVTASALDCLFMLQAAAGSQACEPECICDLSGDGVVTAVDALACLRFAVGLSFRPLCCGETTTTTTTTLAPNSCGSAEVPLCDGVCGEGQACVSGIGGCHCRSYNCPVGAYTGGRCSGLCAGGAACVYSLADGCQCRSNVGACESAGSLACRGTCSDGSYCTRDLVSGGCQCQAVACGGIADAPSCFGVCPAGSVCTVSGSECACATPGP